MTEFFRVAVLLLMGVSVLAAGMIVVYSNFA